MPRNLVAEILELQAKAEVAESWSKARHMVITYLRNNHNLEDDYQWAFKTIELLKELEELREKK